MEARGRTADHGVVRDFGAACVDIVSFGANDRLFDASAMLHREPAASAARLMAVRAKREKKEKCLALNGPEWPMAV